LNQLLATYHANVITALRDEEQVITESGFAVDSAHQAPVIANESLLTAAQENITLCKELISITAEQARPAAAIVPDLIASTHRLRLSLSSQSAVVQASQKAQP
jgi:hypothetical protein